MGSIEGVQLLVPLPEEGLTVDHLAAVELVGALPDERPCALELDLTPLLTVLEQPKALSHDLARRLVAPRRDASGQEQALRGVIGAQEPLLE